MRKKCFNIKTQKQAIENTKKMWKIQKRGPLSHLSFLENQMQRDS